MGQSNVLLRIYYVRDFPLHTLLLEIRKGYFMAPENKFATAEEEMKKKEGKIDRTLQYQVVSKQRNLKGAGQVFKKMIASCFSLFLSLAIFLPSLCFKSLLGLSSENVSC